VLDRSENRRLKKPQVSKNRGFTSLYSTVSRRAGEPCRSDGPWATKEPDREHENGADETENAVNGDSDQAERKRQEPDKWIQDESQQRQRPAKNKQNDPQEESGHGDLVGGM
jgi:hypothetical protein